MLACGMPSADHGSRIQVDLRGVDLNDGRLAGQSCRQRVRLRSRPRRPLVADAVFHYNRCSTAASGNALSGRIFEDECSLPPIVLCLQQMDCFWIGILVTSSAKRKRNRPEPAIVNSTIAKGCFCISQNILGVLRHKNADWAYNLAQDFSWGEKAHKHEGRLSCPPTLRGYLTFLHAAFCKWLPPSGSLPVPSKVERISGVGRECAQPYAPCFVSGCLAGCKLFPARIDRRGAGCVG